MKHLFFSPHIDDVFLSAYGHYMTLLLSGFKPEIIYIFSNSDWTNPENIAGLSFPKDVSLVSAIRKAEEVAIAAQLNHRYEFWDYDDRPLRSGDLADEQKMKAILKNRIRRMLDQEDTGYFPVALSHPDHVLVRDIGIELGREGRRVAFYEDIPYMAFGNVDFIAFQEKMKSCGYYPALQKFDIFQKQELLKKYSTQVSYEWLTGLKNYAYQLETGQYVERLWKPEGSAMDFSF